jgi:MoxR-like ATPase
MTFNYDSAKDMANAVKEEVAKVIVGNDEIIDLMLTGIIAKGNILMEGVPGLGKTMMVRALAKALDVGFSRIQFTPDMMPSDVIGTNVFNMKTSEFYMRKGPIFTNILLGDEINRTPPKTQSALLQAMEEKQVTIDGIDYKLEEPFVVFATQNPIEYEGTYPLPEAQLDRFMLKINVDYPSTQDSMNILKRFNENGYINDLENVLQAADKAAIVKASEEAFKVNVEDSVINYINQIVEASRKHMAVRLGASPRAGIALLMAAKAFAVIDGRDYASPDDVGYLAPFVLEHRIILNAEDEIEGVTTESVINSVLQSVKVPR